MLLKNIIVCVVKTIQFLCSFLQYSCTPEDATKISMSVTGASDGSGSGLAKYLFFVDNNSNNATQINADSTGKKTYSYTTTTGYHTCHVSAVDKAGNVSNTKSFAEGRTKLYAYDVYTKGKGWLTEQQAPYTFGRGFDNLNRCLYIAQGWVQDAGTVWLRLNFTKRMCDLRIGEIVFLGGDTWQPDAEMSTSPTPGIGCCYHRPVHAFKYYCLECSCYR